MKMGSVMEMAAAIVEAQAALQASQGRGGSVSVGKIAAAHSVNRATLGDRVRGHAGSALWGAAAGKPTLLPT